MRILYLIPARKGSKGLPGKNIKKLGNKLLIEYSIDFVLENIQENDELCISSDDPTVFQIAQSKGVLIPFVRPQELANDNSTTYDVIMHAIKFYASLNRHFDVLILLQPTSPIRIKNDLKRLIEIYSDDIDMVVSVKKSKENPYFTLFEESSDSFLFKSKGGYFECRQDCPEVYAFNGSMYLINIKSLLNSGIKDFKKVKKIVMPEERSVDIDTMADWVLAEYYISQI